MPTLNTHTHCQAAKADTHAKNWQRVCLFNRTTDRQTDEEKEALGVNRLLAQWRVTLMNNRCKLGPDIYRDCASIQV